MARDGVAGLYERFERNKKTGVAADMLMELWYLETLYGPMLLDDQELLGKTREARIAVVRGLAEQAAEIGGPGSMRAMHLQTLLGFLLARDERLEEAEVELAEVEPLWKSRVDPNDPWLADINLVRTVVLAGLGVAALESAPPKGETLDALEVLERTLFAHVNRLKGQSDGVQLRRFALHRLRQMYSTECFGNAEWEKWTVDLLRYLGVDAIETRIAGEDEGSTGGPAPQALATGMDTGD
jgi:hypothetical protein